MRYFYRTTIIIAIIALCVAACSKGTFSPDQRDLSFNESWKFIRDSMPDDAGTGLSPENPAFDDSKWQSVDLPHDWSIVMPDSALGDSSIGPFIKSSPGATATGYVLGGTSWYRKHFMLDESAADKVVTLRFDGVYMETEVWVNGKFAGNHVYGYTPFYFDITSMLNPPGQDNIIAVKVSNTGRNSRWYSGSGIYRNVFLTITGDIHVPVWGVKVTTPKVTEKEAMTEVAVAVRNNKEKEAGIKIGLRILAPDGGQVYSTSSESILTAKTDSVINYKVIIENPVLWSPSSPGLYQAVVSITADGKIADQFTQTFGIRSIEITAEKGFVLNGKPVELKGGCMHHDNGLLGSAAYERAEERRVQIMKANGFNAIRTSHNPPSEAFLDACDRLGMMVIDETFDMWERPKNPMDYHRFFREWWKKDVEAMIMRDRNHPCIIMWSIGNEINERADSSGLRIASEIINQIRQYDSTRAFTNAICDFWDIPGRSWETTAGAFELLDVGGYNYQYQRYDADHGKYPERVMMGTESVPKDAWDNWNMVEKFPYVIGDFVWTGMDYLGETGIGHTQYMTGEQKDQFAMTWPWFNAWCGDIDIIGDKKPQMLYRDVIWGNSPIEMNVHSPFPQDKKEVVSYWGWPDEYPHWNWKGYEDKMLQVSVYTKGDAVRLFLNGREIGYRQVSPETKLTAIFEVPYEPGELKAVAYKNEKEFANKVFRTSGSASAMRLTADRKVINADRSDLSFVTIEIVDEFGQLVTDGSVPVKVEISGNGELAGSGNACPWDMKSVGNTTINTFHGKAMVIIRPFAREGSIQVVAHSERIKDTTLLISVSQ